MTPLPLSDDGRRWRRGLDDAFDDHRLPRTGFNHSQVLDGPRLDEFRRPHDLHLQAQPPVDDRFLVQQLLRLFHAVPVLLQLELLPGGEQQHGDEEDTEADGAPHLPMALEIDLPDDRIVPDVLLDRPLERFAHVDSPCWASANFQVTSLKLELGTHLLLVTCYLLLATSSQPPAAWRCARGHCSRLPPAPEPPAVWSGSRSAPATAAHGTCASRSDPRANGT